MSRLALLVALVVAGCSESSPSTPASDKTLAFDASAPAPIPREGGLLQAPPSTDTSIDAQCQRAWSGYTGTWVGGGKNGAPGRCDNDGCGELQCTNTEWANYCFNYNCPAGYICTLGGKSYTGPLTIPYCSCLPTSATSGPTVYVADGTPCGDPAGNRVCTARACVPRP